MDTQFQKELMRVDGSAAHSADTDSIYNDTNTDRHFKELALIKQGVAPQSNQ